MKDHQHIDGLPWRKGRLLNADLLTSTEDIQCIKTSTSNLQYRELIVWGCQLIIEEDFMTPIRHSTQCKAANLVELIHKLNYECGSDYLLVSSWKLPSMASVDKCVNKVYIGKYR